MNKQKLKKLCKNSIRKILPPHTRHFLEISSDNFIFVGLDKDEDECSDTINLIAALK